MRRPFRYIPTFSGRDVFGHGPFRRRRIAKNGNRRAIGQTGPVCGAREKLKIRKLRGVFGRHRCCITVVSQQDAIIGVHDRNDALKPRRRVRTISIFVTRSTPDVKRYIRRVATVSVTEKTMFFQRYNTPIIFVRVIRNSRVQLC